MTIFHCFYVVVENRTGRLWFGEMGAKREKTQTAVTKISFILPFARLPSKGAPVVEGKETKSPSQGLASVRGAWWQRMGLDSAACHTGHGITVHATDKTKTAHHFARPSALPQSLQTPLLLFLLPSAVLCCKARGIVVYVCFYLRFCEFVLFPLGSPARLIAAVPARPFRMPPKKGKKGKTPTTGPVDTSGSALCHLSALFSSQSFPPLARTQGWWA